MPAYVCKTDVIKGTSYVEIERKARHFYKGIALQSKRQPYIRSKYYQGDKIFLSPYWQHLSQKRQRDRKRRLRYLRCAIELLQNTVLPATTKVNVNKPGETLYRFSGLAKDGQLFYVQVKLNQKTNNKYLMSAYPIKRTPQV